MKNMKKPFLFILIFINVLCYGQTDLEGYFNLCLEFGAPIEVVQLFQPFRTQRPETNGTVSFVVSEDLSLLPERRYSGYQIWYTIDKELGLYQSSLFVLGENPALQLILTSYLRKFSEIYGEPVYTNLSNGSILIFWYDEERFIVKARLILDIVNPYKFVSITHCSPQARHNPLLESLYSAPEE
jgi:hypothetical protein